MITKTVRGSRREAEHELARMVTEAGINPAAGSTATIADLFNKWLPKAKLAPYTREDYRSCWELHIEPAIGHMQVYRLRAHHLDDFYAALERTKGLGPARIRKVHAVLRSAIKQAVKWRWIATNVAIDASPPSAPKKEIQPPTTVEVRNIVDKAEKLSTITYVALHLKWHLGARRGEICGLRWRDIDLENNSVAVRRNVGVVAGEEFIKERKHDKVKAAALDPTTIAVLRKWKNAEAARHLAAGDAFSPDTWVFQNEDGSFMRPDTFTHRYVALRKAVGVSARLHDLRHYVATQLLQAGVDPVTVAGRLGHAKVSTTTDIYAAFVPARDRDASDALARINNSRA